MWDGYNQDTRCMLFLGDTNTYIEHIGSLDMTNNKVENPSSQSTPQVLPSFKVYTSFVTYREKVQETVRTSLEVERLDHTQLEVVSLDTYNHDILLSYREVHSFDEQEPQPQPLPNFISLDVNLEDKRGTDSPINPCSPGSFRMKVVDPLIIYPPPSPHVAYFHP
uniref:Uncharacterized protein n=1 Tax=Tanacetum cinerariifolium TaxID=118510 RepID=A0A699GLW6_TANCI|nr:hypothetical protein [Tanacetum cinerariifolium]